MERKLAAILCADVSGYSRLMGDNEEATLRTLSSHRKIIDNLIAQHHGRFVNSAGDSVLAEFASVVSAVQCGVEVQLALKAENSSLPSDRRMEFRIGINLGDVMVEGEQIYGDGVNVAARLESLAEAGGICISNAVHDQIGTKLALGYFDLGEQNVKNITKPVRVFRVLLNGTVTPRGTRKIPRRYWRGGVFSLAGLAIIIVTILLVQHVSLKPPHSNASIPPQERTALALPDKPSIAVLPFINLSGDHNQQYFSDGIADQLINDLSRLPGLFVIARNSSFAYEGKNAKEKEIGKELGVKYLLEGSVRNAADQLRIGVELVDATSGTEMWTGRFDRPLEDVFDVQDEIVGKVVATLGLIFELGQRRTPGVAAFRPTDKIDAYDDFLRGVEYYWWSTKEDNAVARQWLLKATASDPRFSAAYTFLAWTYWIAVWNRWSQNPHADLQRCTELAHKALALDDSDSEGFALLSYVDWMDGRFEQAVADARRAVAIDPNYAAGYAALSDALANALEPEEALGAAQRAMRLDPANADYYAYCVGNAYALMARYQEAITVFKQNLSAYPNNLVAHLILIVADTELGRDQDSRTEATEVMRISPHFTVNSLRGLKTVQSHKNWEVDWRRAGLK